MTRLPLDGVLVLDLTRALAGPYCTALLGDLGADVIKVESRKGGDVTRAWPPFEGEHSLYFDSVNRNKRSVAVDLRTDEGKRLIRRMALEADVVVENFRAGVMQDLGLHELRSEKPALVVGSVSAFGRVGPLAAAAGLDQVAQAMSGLMSVTGPSAEETYRFGVPIIDMTAGILCALGIVAELFQRERIGVGGEATTSLLEAAVGLAAFHGQDFLSTRRLPRPHGNDHASLTPYGVFETQDIPIVLAVGGDAQWCAFCEAIALPELATDPRFASGRSRTEHRTALAPILRSALARRPAAEWLELIAAAGIPCGPIYNYEQVFEDAQVRALGLVHEGARADGSRLPLIRGPLSIDGVATPVRLMPPELGADDASVLRDLLGPGAGR